MVLALVLAQLVLPGPPSKPLSPPGMVCMGECSDGPMVWRASPARGRLVVACDMTSDTCSDGRKITTVRATPVPCETSPGVWEIVPADQGCYSVRGLESWAATTSYLSYGAELDQWAASAGLVVTETPDGQGWRLTNSTGDSQARLTQAIAQATPGEERALTCYARAASVSAMTILRDWSLGRNQVPLQTHWSQVANVGPAEGGGSGVLLAPWPRDLQGAAVDVAGCWLAKATTPGRACWGGEAPVTCAGDRHRISTEGWPTEAGEVSLVYTPGQAENAGRFLISAATFGVEGWEFYVRNDDTMSFFVHNDGTAIYSSAPLTWEPRPYALRVRWGDGIVSFWRDGVLVGTRAMTLLPNKLPSTALIGRRDSSGYANGSISSLRVRSAE